MFSTKAPITAARMTVIATIRITPMTGDTASSSVNRFLTFMFDHVFAPDLEYARTWPLTAARPRGIGVSGPYPAMP
jgi:hypothetical protein